MKNTLTDKQAAFVVEYLVDLNATQAAVRAGYSAKTASRIGQQLLDKTCIAAAIDAAKKKRMQRVERTGEDVLRDIIAVTRQARKVGDLKTALKGLELEGKHHALFTERVQAEVSGGLEISWQE